MRRCYHANKHKETPEHRAQRAAKVKAYRVSTLSHRKSYNRKWYLENREYKLLKTGTYQKANREKGRVRAAIWRKKNTHKTRAYHLTRRSRHLEKMRESNRQRYRRNKKEYNRKTVARRRLLPESRKEAQRAKMRAYYRKNRVRYYAHVHKRRALKKAVEVNPEMIFEWMSGIKSKPFAFCYYCQERISTATIQFDHVLALTKGGPHSISNLAVSCRPCNAQKYNTLIHEWNKSGQQILSL